MRQRADIDAIKRGAAIHEVDDVMDVLAGFDASVVFAVLAEGALPEHSGAEA